MNNRFLHGVLTALALTATATSYAQNPTVYDASDASCSEPREPRPLVQLFPVPSDRQWQWQQTEFYAFSIMA